ncbi:inhibitor of nuclear factor kappa-B kinase-interacting protein isoform X1 [Conger conger]|uniref:inhibitor of nuclear factor kappa-B kinase-interacting protein isoform X1 n=1 Tax=Conger conger TaxID=82655 RepID=UPI002A5A9C24|nr:inhibitor of nuclear factor kappa-B kinase-interacting protein isoform X1 [Conger conger]XP_061107189.1 inhibitor of nuclear factor kappa-B kinase-interacting protein isoform X1 [Conger conger]
MPSNELKQRKKTTPQAKQDEKSDETSKPTAEEEEAKKADVTEGKLRAGEHPTPQTLDLRTIACLVSITVCLTLSWVVLQQNIKFAEVEEKYELLFQKTVVLQELENDIGQISRKLDSSENDLQGAVSSVSLVNKLERDISGLHTVIMAMQDSERSASFDIQGINRQFLNVTEAWQASLELITRDIGGLKAESRAAHGRVTEHVNEAEAKVRDMQKRLAEMEDSTRLNARVLENTEEDDMRRVRDQLDRNTRQIEQLDEWQRALSRRDQELQEALAEHQPRAERCKEQLPAVEEAVRSILRLTADLSAAQRRVEELTLQVFGVEDSALKAVSEILSIQQALDAMQADDSILKMRNEMGIVKETVKEMYRASWELGLLEPPNREEVQDGGEHDDLPEHQPAELGDV